MGIEIDLLQFPKITRLRKSTEEAREIARRFDKEFFDGDRANGYGGYVYDGRWKAVAQRLAMIYLLRKGATVLDVGCGKGFLVKDFRDIGVHAWGIDISEYAIENVMPEVKDYCGVGNAKSLFPHHARQFDLVLSINTIHNLPREECAKALREIERVAHKRSYIVVDAYRNDEEKRAMEDWNLTAKTMMHVDEWREFFKENGFTGDYMFFNPVTG